jgi:Zn-dependent peptidase ImmA (M78 family)
MNPRASDVSSIAEEHFYLAGAEIPVDLDRLCSCLYLNLVRLPFAADDVAAFFSTAQRAIVVNSIAPVGRARFSIAHELGHYALGFGAGVAFFGRRGASEHQANAFAAALLMPRPIVLSVCARLNRNYEPMIRWPELIACHFAVSNAAAKVRLKEVRFRP